MIRHFFVFCSFFFGVLFFISCAVHPKNEYLATQIPIAPDYNLEANWAALPDRKDLADSVPLPEMKDIQLDAKVDVFFIHPTTYTNKRGNDQWNGPVDDPKLNEHTDEGSILYQASIFNGVGRIYAPRYRQAHIYSYFAKRDTAAAREAFDIAYEDVRRAFLYYLDHFNQGRPILLATHSQGATHGIHLLKEFFDGQPLQKQLVAAYLVGMPVLGNTFMQIKPCEVPEETGCFCSWRTAKRNFEPKFYPLGPEIVVTNPLSWTTEPGLVPKSENRGGVLRDFRVIFPELANAEINNGILWTDKPKFPWSFLVTFRNYHIVDYNLYYLNIRENAQLRASTFLDNNKAR